MDVSTEYAQLLNFLSQLLPLMQQHQQTFTQTSPSYAAEVQTSLNGVTSRLNNVLDRIKQTQVQPQDIFVAAQPRMMSHFKSTVYQPYVGWRFLRPIRADLPYEYQRATIIYHNYVVDSVFNKTTATVHRVNMNGQSLGPPQSIKLINDKRKGFRWIFETGNRLPDYPDEIEPGIATEEGLIVTSSQDPYMNFKGPSSMKTDTQGMVIPELGLVASIDRLYVDYPYVVVSLNPPTLKYTGADGNTIQFRRQVDRWETVNGERIVFGVRGQEKYNPPR